jgi:hypothetical protein
MVLPRHAATAFVLNRGSEWIAEQDHAILIGGGAGLEMEIGEIIAGWKHQVTQVKTTNTRANNA